MKSSLPNTAPHYQTRVIKKIEEISLEEFNKTFPKVPESYYFYKTLERSKFNQTSFYYILVYERNQLIALAPCFTTNYFLDSCINNTFSQFLYSVRQIFPYFFQFKTLVCGNALGQGQMGILQYDSNILKAIEERMIILARKIKAPITAFKDFDQTYRSLLNSLLKNNFIRIKANPLILFKINYSDFEEYLSILSRKNRYDFRRKLRKSSSIKIDSCVVNILDEETLNEVYQLYIQSTKFKYLEFEAVTKEFFYQISKNMPNETKFFLWYINGKLVAFDLCLVSNGVLLDSYFGYDYTLAHEYHLYFVKFKDMFNWCLKNDVSTREMGSLGSEAKRNLGWDFIPTYHYLKINSFFGLELTRFGNKNEHRLNSYKQ